jgi:hypothetical protein
MTIALAERSRTVVFNLGCVYTRGYPKTSYEICKHENPVII